MITKYTSLIVLVLGLSISLSAQYTTSSTNIEGVYNDNSIGKSLQLQVQKKYGPLHFALGVRYHLKQIMFYNKGNTYYKTMYPVNFKQHFGPTLSVMHIINFKQLMPDFFIGYKTEMGIMARKILHVSNISTGERVLYNTDSPLIRWDNQLIVGAYLPVHKKVYFKGYGGIGISGIFNDENAFSKNSHEFSASFGLGLSYKLN